MEVINDVQMSKIVPEEVAKYASEVASSRAIPNIDGFKPVNRRMVITAYDLGLWHSGKFVKAAKLEGQCMGNYHPHGGCSAAGLIQPFACRYPLMLGHGNWGSPDSPECAASRYTELKLSEFCEKFYINSIEYADHNLNYDGSKPEVTKFYPPIPGCLLFGGLGMAVGMSTNFPSHNATDVCNSLLAYLSGGDYLNIMPDTPEKTIILTDRDSIRKMYETGTGSIQYKGTCHYEFINGKYALVIDSFPPAFSKKKLQSADILEEVDKGNLELVNESRENIRYVFMSVNQDLLKSIEEKIINTIGYNFYIENNGVVKLMSLSRIYSEFVAERIEYIKRKYQAELDKISEDASYYDLVLKIKDSQEFKNFVNYTHDELKNKLMAEYGVTEAVAARVLNSRLGSFLKDNRNLLQRKLDECNAKIIEYKCILERPIDKIISDIKDFKKYLKEVYHDTNNSIHIDDIKSNNVEGLDPDAYYVVGFRENVISIMKGSDVPKSDDVIGYIKDEHAYYALIGSEGYIIQPAEVLRSKGSLLKSDDLIKIVGFNNLDDMKDSYISRKQLKFQPLGDFIIANNRKKIVTGHKLCYANGEPV